MSAEHFPAPSVEDDIQANAMIVNLATQATLPTWMDAHAPVRFQPLPAIEHPELVINEAPMDEPDRPVSVELVPVRPASAPSQELAEIETSPRLREESNIFFAALYLLLQQKRQRQAAATAQAQARKQTDVTPSAPLLSEYEQQRQDDIVDAELVDA